MTVSTSSQVWQSFSFRLDYCWHSERNNEYHIMKIQATYPELEELIRSKSGKRIYISYVRDDVAKIGYEFSVKMPIVGEIGKTVSADIRYVGINGSILKLQIVDSFVVPAAISPFISRIKDGLLTMGEDNSISIDLSRIDNMDKVLSAISINGMAFRPDIVELDVTVR